MYVKSVLMVMEGGGGVWGTGLIAIYVPSRCAVAYP